MKLLAGFLAAIVLSSCATSIAPPASHGSVDHVVLIWLKKPGNNDDRLAIVQAANDLRTIPGIQFLDSGFPLPSDRPVVDDSFDVGLTMRFDSAAALHAYETHPLHVKKVTEVLRPLSKKIQVYDIVR